MSREGAADMELLEAAAHPEPHRFLGAHAGSDDGRPGVFVRAFHPEAISVTCLLDGGVESPDRRRSAPVESPLRRLSSGGVFETFLPGASLPLRYRLRFTSGTGAAWERRDPYSFLPTLGDLDLHLFNEGTHLRLWRCLGAHPRRLDGAEGVSFAVWAPNASRVSVVGDFCGWDGRIFPMRVMGSSGIFELFIPGLAAGDLYKYEIRTGEGHLRLKTDPFAFRMERPPGSASQVWESSHEWRDGGWMKARATRDPRREPMAIYEVHAGSWARVPEEGARPLNWRELAPRLAAHARRLGFTHVELMPIAEFPFDGSWGYQVSGYFAPTSRFGTPDDFRFFVDTLHAHGLGVLLDWVPAHFPKDDFALRLFDGTPLYEHADPRRGEHPDWGTLIFNYGRHEVRSFLVANALYWLHEFHLDGLRVDAVASMIYLDYSRRDGEWLPNEFGGRENLEAIDFLRALNEAVRVEQPGCITLAEESTAWPGVTRPASDGGLGFTFKWNMGWMHDTLQYLARDPIHRRFHQDQLTFAMLYEYSEAYVMPLSHDEVVHGKGSLLSRMPGDDWQKMANLRLLLAYQYTRPGKKLLFMGTELAPPGEWRHDASLDWHLAADPEREGLAFFLRELGELYLGRPCLWRRDHEPGGFAWIDCTDRDNSILSYERRDGDAGAGHETHAVVGTRAVVGARAVVVLNLTPVPREAYRVGAPVPGRWRLALNSDAGRFGGSGFAVPAEIETEPLPFHGREQSFLLELPPLAALILEPEC